MGGAGGHQHCPGAAPNFPGDSAGFHSFWASQTQDAYTLAPKAPVARPCSPSRGWGGLGEAQTAGGAGGAPSIDRGPIQPFGASWQGQGLLGEGS